jgi:hypothetical protein
MCKRPVSDTDNGPESQLSSLRRECPRGPFKLKWSARGRIESKENVEINLQQTPLGGSRDFLTELGNEKYI